LIQLESVLHVPLLDVSGTSGLNGQAGSCVVDALRVLVESDAMGLDDVNDWIAIHGKQQWTGYSDLQGGR